LCELAASDAGYRAHVVALSLNRSIRNRTGGQNVSGRVMDPWTFVRTEQLVSDAQRLVEHLDPSIELVVGVTRSGLVPASIVAARLHRPLMTASHLGRLVDVSQGKRFTGHGAETRHVLVLDGTAALAGTIGDVTPLIRKRFPRAQITRAVVYAHPHGQHEVDLFWAELAGAHFLEWNWQNAGHGEHCGFDFDGILCRDTTPGEMRLTDIPPLYLPRRLPVPLIASGRGEECREASQSWLTRHGVRWERLELRPAHVPFEAHTIALWKADVFASSGCTLFAESDPIQARLINERTGKPVLCPELGQVLPPAPSVDVAGDLAAVFACMHRAHCRCSTVECRGGKRHGRRVTLSDCLSCLAE
jgi:hypothetical protein